MPDERRRRALTPLESELRAQHATAPAQPSFADRLRRRRARHAPKTLTGAIVLGLVRLTVAALIASGAALLVDHWLHRSSKAVGFYVVGAALLAAAVGMSSGLSGRRSYGGAYERERRVSLSFSYILAGLVVIAVGVAIEATR